MGRYILRYKNAAHAPESHLKAIRAAANVKIVDESPRMVLVEANEDAAQASVQGLAGWSVTPETTIPLPRVHEKIR